MSIDGSNIIILHNNNNNNDYDVITNTAAYEFIC